MIMMRPSRTALLSRPPPSALPRRLLASSAPAPAALVEITVNGRPVRVPPGSALIHACEAAGATIPRFCFHDRLAVAGNCRMCLVEVAKSPKPVASCAMPVAPGMVVLTDSPLVKKAREGVLEFILANHPLDCPICDQAGECDLQDQTMRYGNDRTRFNEPEGKRAVEDKYLGPLVSTCLTRCIQCTRCVRFANEIAGAPELGTTGRGADMQIGTYIDSLLLDTELSGNVVDLCPVGALTSRPYAFRARPWELKPTPTIDVHDAVGCRIRVDSRASSVLRVLPRDCTQINEEWISDKSRHACDGLAVQRLTTPIVATNNTSASTGTTWTTAFDFIARHLQQIRGASAGFDAQQDIAAVVGELADAESMVVLRDWMLALGSRRLVVDAFGEPAAPIADFAQNYLLNRPIISIDDADAILLVGCNPRHEAAVLNVRLRRAWLRGANVALVGSPPTHPTGLAYDATLIPDHVAGLASLASGKHAFASVLERAKRPLILVGSAIYSHPQLRDILKQLAAIEARIKSTGALAFLQHGAGHVAALEIGYSACAPRKATQTTPPLPAKFVILLNADNMSPETERSLIGPDTFVVYIGHHGDRGAAAANAVLPAAAYTEKCATYVNIAGTAQRTSAAVAPPGAAREDWTIVRALAEYTGTALPYDNIYALRRRMSLLSPRLISGFEATFNEPGSSAAALLARLLENDKAAPKAQPNAPLVPAVSRDTFYLSNPIARASKTMAECQTAFVRRGKVNGRRAAV